MAQGLLPVGTLAEVMRVGLFCGSVLITVHPWFSSLTLISNTCHFFPPIGVVSGVVYLVGFFGFYVFFVVWFGLVFSLQIRRIFCVLLFKRVYVLSEEV